METPQIEKNKKVNRKSRQRYIKHIYKHLLSHNIHRCTNTHCITCAKLFVANLSGRDLTGPQILLVSKGLSFIPTAKDSSHFELLKAFNIYIMHHSLGLDVLKTMVKKFPCKRIQKYKSKQTFFSFPSYSLEGVLEAIKMEISQIPVVDNPPKNLSLSERKAL